MTKGLGCSVTECKYNCKDANYCTLNKIKIGTHESTPKTVECTYCEPFELD
nr:DUF1540 domain-containing protein [Clostridium puniceum]